MHRESDRSSLLGLTQLQDMQLDSPASCDVVQVLPQSGPAHPGHNLCWLLGTSEEEHWDPVLWFHQLTAVPALLQPMCL